MCDCFFAKADAKVQHFSDICKYFSKKSEEMRFLYIFYKVYVHFCAFLFAKVVFFL